MRNERKIFGSTPADIQALAFELLDVDVFASRKEIREISFVSALILWSLQKALLEEIGALRFAIVMRRMIASFERQIKGRPRLSIVRTTDRRNED